MTECMGREKRYLQDRIWLRLLPDSEQQMPTLQLKSSYRLQDKPGKPVESDSSLESRWLPFGRMRNG